MNLAFGESNQMKEIIGWALHTQIIRWWVGPAITTSSSKVKPTMIQSLHCGAYKKQVSPYTMQIIASVAYANLL